MKKYLILLFIPVLCWGQITGMGTNVPPQTRLSSEQEYIGGEHSPLIFTQTLTLPTGTGAWTRWFQTGWSPNGAASSNANIQMFNPELFTVTLKDFAIVSATAGNDSVGVGYGRIECAYDTTDDDVWNADSSNIFIDNAAYSHALYGTWKFLPFKRVATNTTDFAYPVRIFRGGFARVYLEGRNDMVDSCNVVVELTGEN